MQQEWSSSAAIESVWYYAPYCTTVRRPWVQTMSIVLLRPLVILTKRSTDWPCALSDMFNTTRSFTHMSNTCVIRRLLFLNLGFIDLMPCTTLPAALHILASQNSGLSTNLETSRLNRIGLLWTSLLLAQSLIGSHSILLWQGTHTACCHVVVTNVFNPSTHRLVSDQKDVSPAGELAT